MSHEGQGQPRRGPATWSLGTVVAGRYRLESLLGAGAFGAVFRAIDARTPNAPVALKLLSRASLSMPDSQARFAREARILMGLKHPATVRVLDAGDAGGGVPYIAFELLEGRSLEARLAEGPLSLTEVLRITMELLGSLEEAHAQHVIHRDVKPANVFLCGGGASVKLLDFGLAKEAPRGVSLERMTAEGALVGTPEYMAPEQLQGGPIGPSTDLFALGLLLAEMLSGTPVYTGPVLSVCVSKLNGLAPALSPAIPVVFVSILRRATTMDPAQRYASADQMKRALTDTGLLQGPPTKPPSGKSGTQVMTIPTPPSGSQRVSALAATTQPAESFRPAGKSRVDPLAATRPLSDGPVPAHTPGRGRSAILAGTVNDDTLRRKKNPALDATVDLDHAPSRIPPLALPAPKPRRPWLVILVGVVLLLSAGAAGAVWWLRL